MEIFASIILIAVVYCMCHATEWRSNNYIPPKGMKTDWRAANTDLTLYGKDYYYKKHAAGGYNIPDKK